MPLAVQELVDVRMVEVAAQRSDQISLASSPVIGGTGQERCRRQGGCVIIGEMVITR